jgi:hypothetical protein
VGHARHRPVPTHAVEGLAGVWNTLGNMVPVQQYPLVGLDGQPTAAYIFQVGFDTIQSFDNPATSGDDQALLDDCYTSFNDPLDGCLFIRNIEPGDYRIVMYGLAPTTRPCSAACGSIRTPMTPCLSAVPGPGCTRRASPT